MPYKCDLALQNIPLSKHHFKMQFRIENEDGVTWNPQFNLPTTRINKHTRALSLQEVELDGWLYSSYCIKNMYHIKFMYKFNTRYVFRFYIIRLMSWIRTNPSTQGLKFESPSKWNLYEGVNLEHWSQCVQVQPNARSMFCVIYALSNQGICYRIL